MKIAVYTNIDAYLKQSKARVVLRKTVFISWVLKLGGVKDSQGKASVATTYC